MLYSKLLFSNFFCICFFLLPPFKQLADIWAPESSKFLYIHANKYENKKTNRIMLK